MLGAFRQGLKTTISSWFRVFLSHKCFRTGYGRPEDICGDPETKCPNPRDFCCYFFTCLLKNSKNLCHRCSLNAASSSPSGKLVGTFSIYEWGTGSQISLPEETLCNVYISLSSYVTFIIAFQIIRITHETVSAVTDLPVTASAPSVVSGLLYVFSSMC